MPHSAQNRDGTYNFVSDVFGELAEEAIAGDYNKSNLLGLAKALLDWNDSILAVRFDYVGPIVWEAVEEESSVTSQANFIISRTPNRFAIKDQRS